MKDANSGVSTLTADTCAGCHRAHTAQGPLLINAPTEEALCVTCHGAASAGATTDVMTGVQYVSGAAHAAGGAQLGALRSGGFDQARLDTANPIRQAYLRNATAVSQRPKVEVLATPQDITSSHIALTENGLTNPGIAWGNGDFSATANPGPAVAALSCANCHNPHGNGNYRILNPIPEADGADFVDAATAVNVTDAALPEPGDARNYTVIQTLGTQGNPGTFLLYASQVSGVYSPTSGDYWHVRVPWNSTTSMSDAPNGNPAGATPFNTQIGNWCTTCHSRYMAESGATEEFSGDVVFSYRHQTTGRTTCTTCHVAHGSNAGMPGTPGVGPGFTSSAFPYPNGTTSGSSRLLKVDNRGTCQMCHDPTGTVTANTYTGPLPTPGVP